ncbi:hypothetical protein PINS_up021772 [Pythium insidiosum]|nr:hypothetical protein PINS_up021772 [Pythium insidiosum]
MNSASTDQASDDIGNQQKKVKADADKDVPSESGTATPKEQVVSIYVYDQPSASASASASTSDGAAFSGGSQGLDGFKVNEAFEFVGVLDLSSLPLPSARRRPATTTHRILRLRR